MRHIDLNADLGESFGVYSLGNDDALLRSVTSANIACGFHAGDPGTMAKAVALAASHHVALGAHPGLPDLVGFGRRRMELTSPEIRDLVTYQIGAVAGFAARVSQPLRHVKPHGALYSMAEADASIADAIAQAVQEWDTDLILVGLSGGKLIAAGRALGLSTASEIFADRAYLSDGTLAPRSQPNAVVHDLEEVIDRIRLWASTGTMASADGIVLTLAADTICFHGDSPNSAALAARVRQVLEAEGIAVQSLRPL